jgi:hypothetical protein
MYKVFAFLKRNPNLTHDEYRAGHVGYHCGQSRRLKNIRGYLVNVWANQPLREKIGPVLDDWSFGAPEDFFDYWDGFPQVYFDDQRSWRDARTVEPNRVTADGLVVDPDWSLADSPHLFMPVPDNPLQFQAIHLHMEEEVVVPVERYENKSTKLIQFFKYKAGVNQAACADRLRREYLPVASSMPGLLGYTFNMRDEDSEAAMRGFFADDDWVFGEEGTALRRAFCSSWDGAMELHFASMDGFVAARSNPRLESALNQMERDIFAANWIVEVDENLIVLPNRNPAPNFYFR